MAVQLAPDDVEALWRPDGLATTPEHGELLTAIRHWLDRLKATELADLLCGKPLETFDGKAEDQIKIIAVKMLAKFHPKKRGVAAIELLGKVIDRGNEEGIFSLCPPPIPYLQPRQSSPFADTRWPQHDLAPRLRTHLRQSIQSPAKVPSKLRGQDARAAQAEVGRLLTSAIVHGGLLHVAQLDAVVRRLLTPTPALACVNEQVYVELSLGWRGQEDAEFRRWFPDPLSAILMLRLSAATVRTALSLSQDSEPPKSLGKAIWRMMRSYFRQSGLRSTDYAPTLATLLDAVRLDLDTRLPPILVNYAAREFVSHSLKPEVWRRIHGLALTASTNALLEDTEAARIGMAPGSGLLADVDEQTEAEPRWLRPLRVAMRSERREEILSCLEHLIAGNETGFAPDDVGALFAGFARRLFAVATTNKVHLTVRTARAYAISAAKRVGGLLGTASISDYGVEEWSGLYAEAIADANTPSMRRKVIRVLREFQRYREIERGADAIDARDVFGVGTSLVPVDANIIAPDEFIRIRERLAQELGEHHPELKAVAWLVITLAYRCGLRRMEALKLELADVCIQYPAELLVRPTESRRLKTKNATRKIPLYAILDADELACLRDWYCERMKSEAQQPYSKFLFAVPKRNFSFVPQDTLFPLLHKIMRDVTGDATLRFHHLRHSFASWLFLRLMASDFRTGLQILSRVANEKLLDDATSFRQRLYGNDWMTRRHVWAVSSLLGHSGPDVSLEHYIHLVDVVLAEFLADAAIAPETATLIAAAGESSAQAYRHETHRTPQRWVAWLWKKAYPQEHRSAKALVIDPDKPTTPTVATHPNEPADALMRVWQLLHKQATEGLTVEQLSERYGIEAEKIRRYLENARTIAALKLSQHGKAFRHRFIDWTPDRRRPDVKQRIACPIQPHEKRDQRLIEKFAARLRELSMDEPELTHSVLGHYIAHSRPDFAGMIFTSPDAPKMALDFMRWWQLLGIERRNLRFVGYDVSSERSKPLGHWKKALGLTWRDTVDKCAPPNGRRDWACPWLGVEPVFLDESGMQTGAAAIRFLMVMGAITLKWPEGVVGELTFKQGEHHERAT